MRKLAPTQIISVLLGGALLLGSSGCFSIERTGSGGRGGYLAIPGRAYFIKKHITGSTLVVCDAKPDIVVCYDSDGGAQ